MNRRNFLGFIASAAAVAAWRPYSLKAEPKTKAPQGMKPRVAMLAAVAQATEELRSQFARKRVFIFESRSGQTVFNVYAVDGTPTVTEIIEVCHCPVGAEKDFDSARLPGVGELLKYPLGSSAYGVQVWHESTPETIRRDIMAAIKLVKT